MLHCFCRRALLLPPCTAAAAADAHQQAANTPVGASLPSQEMERLGAVGITLKHVKSHIRYIRDKQAQAAAAAAAVGEALAA